VKPDQIADRNLTRKEEAYRRVLEIVLKGAMGDDEYLNEQKLAEEFGMSRAPVREALQTLCSEHIMANIPRLGYKVVPISLHEVLDALDVRMLLEIESVRLACHNKSPEATKLLDTLISHEREIHEDEADIHSWIMNGDLVHRSIAEISQNMVLMRTIISIVDLLRRASIQLILEGKKKPEGIHYHLAILEAVREGDEAKAAELMRKDIMILKDIILQR
jgi:DNA-binding GntR family transcriptional regulator